MISRLFKYGRESAFWVWWVLELLLVVDLLVADYFARTVDCIVPNLDCYAPTPS